MKFIFAFLLLFIQNGYTQEELFSKIVTKYNSEKEAELKEIEKATSLVEFESGILNKRTETNNYGNLVERAQNFKFPVIYSSRWGELPNGSVVQGNSFLGGGVPDIYIDGTPQKLKLTIQNYSIEANLKTLKEPIAWFKKIEIAERSVQEIIPHFEYSNLFREEAYKEGIKQFPSSSMGTPLSFFVDMGTGDSRVFAILLVLALKELGIPSKFSYAAIATKLQRGNSIKPLTGILDGWKTPYPEGFFAEDHALVEVSHPVSGASIYLDAYYPDFNGYSYNQIDLQIPTDGNKRIPEIVNTHHLYPVNDKKNFGPLRMEWGAAYYVKGLNWSQKDFEDEFKRIGHPDSPRFIAETHYFPNILVEVDNKDFSCLEFKWNAFKKLTGGVKITDDYENEFKLRKEFLEGGRLGTLGDCAPFNSGKFPPPFDSNCLKKKMELLVKKFKIFYNSKLKADSQNLKTDKAMMKEFIRDFIINRCS
jgi:hypothetical protein